FQIDFVEREGNVLVRLGLDLKLKLFFGLSCWDDDFLGYYHRRGQGERDVSVAASQTLVRASQGVGHLIEVGDIAVGHHVLRQRLDGVSLQPVRALPGLGKLDQLERGRAHVDTDQRRRAGVQKRKCRTEFFLQHGKVRPNTYKLL